MFSGLLRHIHVSLLALLCGLVLVPAANADTGFVDGSFSGTSAPSGMKPQSKLWVADGIWWGVMFDSLTQRFEIYRRNAATEQWSSTGVVVDGRRNIWSDAKWDGTHLFVVTHGAHWDQTLDAMRLARFSYSAASQSWSLDPGYPVDVGATPGHAGSTGTEGAVLDEDSRGRIWITWTRDLKTWITHSTTDTQTFVTPFVVPVPNADNVTSDDMSTLVAYDGRIGVLWSNEATWCMCFAIHNDADADSAWTYKPMLGPAANPADPQQELADDHMNLKAPNDGSGMVYASSKTSLDGMSDPLLLFNVFDGNSWTHYTYATVADQTTRAQIALDLSHKQVYMFNSSPCCNGGIEYYKQSSLVPGHIGFVPGLGTPFIDSAANPNVNNVSTTKQPVDANTDLVAIAGDDSTKTYLHNTLDLSQADTTPPDTSIDSGPSGTDNNPDAKFTFSSTESDSSFDCSLDGGAFSACSSPKTYTGVGDGSHTFRARAIDSSGNVDPTPATQTWTVENTATVVDIKPVADTYVASGSPKSNYGITSTLYTDKSSNGDPSDKQAYFRFTVANTHKIVSAKLLTWVTDGSVGGPSAYLTSNTWDEKKVNWSTRPAPIGTALASIPGAVAKGAYISYDVSAAVTANGTYSFVTITNSTDAVVVASRENTSVAHPPLLELRIDPPPNTNVDSSPPADSNTTSATFAFSSNESGTTFACKLDGGSYTPCSSPTNYGGLADGNHSFSVKATDTTGATDPTPATYTWAVDTSAPAAPTMALTPDSDSGASASDGITSDTSPVFGGTAEPGSLVTVSADSSQLGSAVADAAGDWTLSAEDLPEGSYSVTARAQDGAGNYSNRSDAIALVIDGTPPPAPTISSPASDLQTQARDLTVAGTADAGQLVRVLDDTSTAAETTADASGSWSVDLTGLGDGTHAFTAVALDVAGNVSDPSAVRTVTVDNVAPDTTITDKPPDPAARDIASFSFDSNETGSTYECSLDDAPFAACSSPAGYTDLAAGSHTFAVRAIDGAGNVDATPDTYSWTVNTALPHRPAITSPANGSYSSSATVTVSGTADPSVTVEVFVDGTSVGTSDSDTDGTWSLDVPGLSDGSHSVAATATNSAGSSALSSAVTVTVDTVAPDTSIGAGPPAQTNSTSASFTFSSNESSTTFECSLDDGPFAACTSPRSLTALPDGAHTFTVRALDQAGNVDDSPATYGWTVDTAAPDTTITSGPSGLVSSSTASIEFTAGEAGATFACRLDQGSFAPCTSPASYSNLGPGPHSFDVRATDAAGNTDATPATRSWRVQQVVFSDSFDSSNVFVQGWTPAIGGDGTVAIQSTTVKSAPNAARLTESANSGSFATLRYRLPAPYSDVTVDEDVRVDVQGASGGNVPLLRLFDGTSTRILSLYRQNTSTGTLYVGYGTPTSTNYSLGKNLALGTWAHLTLRVVTGPAGAGTVTVSMNGTQIYSNATASIGTAGVATVQFGNETKSQAFQLETDNVSVTEQ